MRKTHPGYLTVITGCMFSGKTSELIRLLIRYMIAHKNADNVRLFKPANDTRYGGEDKIISHDHMSLTAISVPIDNPRLILTLIDNETSLVGIDEGQFFLEGIVEVVLELIHSGIDVIVAGLNQDSKGEPFGFIGELLVRSDKGIFLDAVCFECGQEATKTQYMGAGPKIGQVVIGGPDLYTAACLEHWTPL